MARPPDLFAAQLKLKLPERTTPRLWVRRLAIWEDLGKPAIREVELHPGLNVIWSPDATSQDANRAVGHGSGKTLFCRLIRYCLGEDRVADEVSRAKIAEKYPDGWVGAEVMLGDECWAVMRPIGSLRRHAVERGKTLEELRASGLTHTGLGALTSAIEDGILTGQTCSLIANQDRGRAWLTSLAWLARDQEARLMKALLWRVASSGSDSPAGPGMTEVQRLDAVRALLRAITVEELEKRAKYDEKSKKEAAEKTLVERLGWSIGRAETAAGQIKASPADPAGALGEAATGRRHLSVVADDPVGAAAHHVAETRKAFKVASAAVAEIKQKLGRSEERLETLPKINAMMRAEIPGLQTAVFNAGNVLCPICEVPIDRVLATKCSLSDKLPDMDACRARIEKKKADLARGEQDLLAAKSEHEDVRRQLAAAESQLQSIEAQLATAESTHLERKSAASAQAEVVARAAGLPALRLELAKAKADLTTLANEKRALAQELADMRGEQAKRIRRLREVFAVIVRQLIGDGAKADIKFHADDLHLSLRLAGEQTSPATTVATILAFDIAAMFIAAEEGSNMPAFLIHDSPREADLSKAIYDRIFDLVRTVQDSAAPLFQYIVTTTTPPPAEYGEKPWCALRLRGAPASERLLRVDL